MAAMVKHSTATGTVLRLVAGGAALIVFCTVAGYWRERTLVAAQAPRAATGQVNLPPLMLPDYQLSRPNNVIRATYRFAADHPEVLNYMPCFCGCEQHGHRSNDDCFVRVRARNGDVTEWEEHGMVCTMCVAVAELSMNMHAKGASLKDIRAAVESQYGKVTDFKTPTPPPPSH